MSSSGLVARDLAFHDTITFTYEWDDGCVRSWIDHILCDKLHVDIVTNIKRADSGTFLSDHFPLSFSLNAECASVCPSFSSKPQKNNSFFCDWAKITSERYQCFVADTLPRLPSEVELCCNPHCSQHCSILENYSNELIDCLLEGARVHLPGQSGTNRRTLPGWNDGPKILKTQANFWHRVWMEAGCPSSGVLSDIRRKTKLVISLQFVGLSDVNISLFVRS